MHCDTEHMGFDPTRKYKKSKLDYLYVGAAVVVGLALLAWVVFG